jgi:mannose-6-phosphate isomerase-like protein (cupin superfamily)
MSPSTQTTAQVVTRAGEGDAYWWFQALAEVKVGAEQTGGTLSVIEITEPPNSQAPLHVHHHDDEAFWILEGDAEFEVGDARFHAGPGDFAFGPRGIPHRFTVGESGCRMLFILTPGGLENAIREMSVPAEQRTVAPPPEPGQEPDWEHVAAVAKAHGCEVLG